MNITFTELNKRQNDLNIILSDEEALNFQKEYKKNQGRLEMTELTKSILDYSPWK